jgi:hypothetical protein
MLPSLKINVSDPESNLATCSRSIETEGESPLFVIWHVATIHTKCLLTQLARVFQTKFKVTKEQHRYKQHKYAIPFSNANVHCLNSECVSDCLNGGLLHPLATDCPRWWCSHGFQLMLVFKYWSLWWRFITFWSTLHQNKSNKSITVVCQDEWKICIAPIIWLLY